MTVGLFYLINDRYARMYECTMYLYYIPKIQEAPFEFEMNNKNRSWADIVSEQEATHLPPEGESTSTPCQAESVSDMSEITAELDSIKGQINGLNGLPATHHLKMTQEVAALSLKFDRIFEYMTRQAGRGRGRGPAPPRRSKIGQSDDTTSSDDETDDLHLILVARRQYHDSSDSDDDSDSDATLKSSHRGSKAIK